MNRADGTHADTTTGSRESSHDDAGAHQDMPAASWDPYQVWLTRIKQPRERAARVAALGRSSNATSARNGAGPIVRPARAT